MIAKEKFFTKTSDPRLKAGDAAEKQMAHYLNRQFADVQGVNVFNDLRLKRDGEVAQIDHLILHGCGTIIIESKSVTTTIRITPQLEFERKSGGKWGGMPSPVEQARRQRDLMRKLLNDHKLDLREKKLFGLRQGTFNPMPIDIRVAISDQGMIQGSRRQLPEVMKADQVAGAAMKIIDSHKQAAKFLTPDDETLGRYTLTPGELERVTKFLLAQHTPSPRQDASSPHKPTTQIPRPTANPEKNTRRGAPRKKGNEIWRERRDEGRRRRLERTAGPAEPKPTPPQANARPLPAYLCSFCQSTNLTIRFRRSYYFNCRDCDGNTAIKNICPQCGQRTITAKHGTTYSAKCTACETDAVFFVNPGK